MSQAKATHTSPHQFGEARHPSFRLAGIHSFAARTVGAKPRPLVISSTQKASARRSANGGCLTFVVHRSSGDSAEAERCWRRILTLTRPRKLARLDQGIYGHLTRRNLAALAMERSDLDEARQQWRAVLEECPGDREALARLAEIGS